MKCDSCGKFRKIEDLIHIWGENEEIWTECIGCTSSYELDKLNTRKQLNLLKNNANLTQA